MSTIDLKAYEIFKSKFGEKDAEIVIEYFESKTESKFQEKKDIFLTKDDKIDMIKWMVGLWLAQMAAIIGIYLTK